MLLLVGECVDDAYLNARRRAIAHRVAVAEVEIIERLLAGLRRRGDINEAEKSRPRPKLLHHSVWICTF